MVGPFILMYHSVGDYPDDPYSVTVGAFRDQLAWLADHGFEVVSLATLLGALREGKGRPASRQVVITFDDGYRDFMEHALPILRDHGAHATVFLVTDLLGGKATWSDCGAHCPLMTEEEARSIKAHGVSLGSHTATHANLPLLARDELQQQLRTSRDRLEQLGETFCALAYPWGQWSQPVAEAVRAVGYECAVVVGERTRLTAADAFCLPRIAMHRDMDLTRFRTLMRRTRLEIELRRRYRNLRERRLFAAPPT